MSKTVIAVFLIFLPLPLLAEKHQPVVPCQTKFSVVLQDHLNNISEGLPEKQANWFKKKIERKYPDVCYVPPSPDVAVVFYIAVTPAVYHGTRVVTSQHTHENPVDGTVTDDYGNRANIHGTETTTTTTSTPVPYSVDYGIFTLTVETSDGPKKWTARHRFEQKGLYRTWAGIPLGGKGHHPFRTVIEEASKWVHEGGLNNPLESVVPQ